MSKFRIVFHKGPSVVLDGAKMRFNTDAGHLLELLDEEGKVIAAFAQFQNWQVLGDPQ